MTLLNESRFIPEKQFLQHYREPSDTLIPLIMVEVGYRYRFFGQDAYYSPG